MTKYVLVDLSWRCFFVKESSINALTELVSIYLQRSESSKCAVLLDDEKLSLLLNDEVRS